MSIALASTGPAAQAPPLGPLADSDLELLLLIRHFEQSLLELFAQGLINGTTHTCLGQEYIPVALGPLLADGDMLFGNHRSHGHYLARFRDPEGLLAEIMGREGAVCGGVGGSQHIYRPGYLSTGVQGAGLPVAAGVALHLKHISRQALALAYIGDGTWGEGAVYETLNIAQLWGLPLVVAVEHNQIALSTPSEQGLAGTVEGRARAFGVDFVRTEARDINQIRAQVAGPIARVRQRRGPLVIEFVTERLGPHSKGDDTRPPEELARLRAQDWYARYRELFPQQFARLDSRARDEMERLVRRVAARPLCAGGRP